LRACPAGLQVQTGQKSCHGLRFSHNLHELINSESFKVIRLFAIANLRIVFVEKSFILTGRQSNISFYKKDFSQKTLTGKN
jgi:hypothetical protein